MLSVDGTTLRLAMKYRNEFWSFKFKESGLRYDGGLNLVMGDIFWWHCSFACGKYNDLTIFQNALKLHLEDDMQVEANMGYKGAAPFYVKCPGGVWSDPTTEELQKRVRTQHETCNNRLYFQQICCFFIICGHLHLCASTSRTTRHFQDYLATLIWKYI